jgi:hypothetical protein
MITLEGNTLHFRFPEIHEKAEFSLAFERTLRIPDDDRDYPLPPGLGRIQLEHVDDYADRAPKQWLKRGGIMMPMFQSEAMWISFNADYPFAVKIATGKVNAVSGEEWTENLNRDPQDYLVLPEQPWLDGYCVEKGVIRQFVAMPLGSGYSVEEQITGAAEHGGLQVMAFPMKAESYERLFGRKENVLYDTMMDMAPARTMSMSAPDMGLAPGGRMKQEIYEDDFELSDWDLDNSGRCFVAIANSISWRAITGKEPRSIPPTARDYADAGMPWFEYYGGDAKALAGAEKFKGVKSVVQKGQDQGESPLPENVGADPEVIVKLGKKPVPGQVREGQF